MEKHRQIVALALAAGLAAPAALRAQEAAPAAPVYDKRIIPPWANTAEPVDPPNHAGYSPAQGDLTDGGGKLFAGQQFGPSTGMQVNLATGSEQYVAAPDMTGHNGIGTDALLRRSYRSDRALSGYGSPGLSPGWVHNYDVTLSAPQPDQWGGLILHHANGCNELLKPTLGADGKPTGKMETGMPVQAVGTPGAQPGQWQGISLTWRDGTHWLFLPFGSGTYVLSGITNLVGNGLYLHWDSARRLLGATDTKAGKPLLTLSYDAGGNLSDLKDAEGLTVHYRFGPQAGQSAPVLQAVSTGFTADAPTALRRYQFTYITGGGRTLLKTIAVPDPGGPGQSIATLFYQSGKVAVTTDGNGNKHVLTYTDGHTRVEVQGPDGKSAGYQTQNFDADGRDTGVTDANGHSTPIAY